MVLSRILVVVLTFWASSAIARTLGESQAFNRAVAILKGNPYGSSYTEVAQIIKSAVLLRNGSSVCAGTVNQAVWSFHVVVPKTKEHETIDGTLDIDAVTGKMVCASLPLLD